MPEHLKVLAIVLSAGFLVFWAAEKIICPRIVDTENFRRRRSVWFCVVLATFLSHNFWFASFLIAIITYTAAKKDSNPLAIYMIIIFAVPWHEKQIPGLGLINHFIDIGHYKILNLTLLLPALVCRNGERRVNKIIRWTDVTVLSYIFYTIVMILPFISLTNALRKALEELLVVVIPYLAFSRLVTSKKILVEVVTAFIISISIIGVLAPLESLKGWLIYESLNRPLGISLPELSTYLIRGDTGLLRAMGTFSHSIVLGYVMMIAIILVLPLQAQPLGLFFRLTILGTLAAGLLFALSRGPWLGCTIGILTYLIFTKGLLKVSYYAIGALGLIIIATYFFPILKNSVEPPPFMGGVDSANIDYRKRLLEVGAMVFWQNPIYGNVHYLALPVMEQMRQGQGIIDIVNTYLAVALAYGALGLILFLIPFIIGAIVSARGFAHASDSEIGRWNAAIFSVLIAIIVTIATVSSIGAIAPLYWIVLGTAIRFGSLPPDSN